MNLKGILAVGIAAAALVISAGAALADPAVATSSVNVRSGPGGNFKVIAKLSAGELVEVNECQGGWCFVERQGTDGWVSASYLQAADDYEEEEEPAPPPQKPGQPQVNLGVTIGPDGKPSVSFGINTPQPKPVPKPPTVCFFDKTNYAGKSFCVPAGTVADSLPGNWDDRISSIQVLNGATVDVCSEEDAYGYCATYTKSRPTLPGQINNDISSYETY